MRSLIAVFVGALAGGVYWGQMYSGALRPQASTPLLLQQAISLGVMALIALSVGFVVDRRGWLAAPVAYLLGLALWVVVDLRPSPPWVPTDVGGTWESLAERAIIGGLWSAIGGAVGSWAARAKGRASSPPPARAA